MGKRGLDEDGFWHVFAGSVIAVHEGRLVEVQGDSAQTGTKGSKDTLRPTHTQWRTFARECTEASWACGPGLTPLDPDVPRQRPGSANAGHEGCPNRTNQEPVGPAAVSPVGKHRRRPI